MAVSGKDYFVSTHDSGSAEVVPDPLPSAGASAVRGTPEWRQLSFRASGLTIELEITGRGDYRRLLGQLIPRQAAVVEAVRKLSVAGEAAAVAEAAVRAPRRRRRRAELPPPTSMPPRAGVRQRTAIFSMISTCCPPC